MYGMNGKRTALITGANKGIGLETARQLGKQGMTVLVGARDRERGARAVSTLRGEAIGGLSNHGDPQWKYAWFNAIAYPASKAALNMVTVQYAKELAGTGIKVNAADPGYTATDLNGSRGTQTVEEGARASVKLALLDDAGPTGGFFDARGEVPW
jgi:NAD(P)-dependent dehydrogenase (short-subunit alcohol dehydrogenase family)